MHPPNEGLPGEFDHPALGRHVRVEQWQNAQAQGVAAAYTLLGMEPPKPPVPWSWSDQGELRLQVAGRPELGAEVVHRGSPEDPAGWCVLHLDGPRVVGAVSLNRPRDIRGATLLIESGAAVAPELRADSTTDLRRVARAAAAAV